MIININREQKEIIGNSMRWECKEMLKQKLLLQKECALANNELDKL